MNLPENIAAFLRKHHVLTLATSHDNTPWVAHCFYAFLEKEDCLVFTTDPETRHGSEMLANPRVSCGIAWETWRVGQIRGAQLQGRAFSADQPDAELPLTISSDALFASARKAYLRRFPYALAMKLDLWILVIDSVKYTDNRLGFGKKVVWER